MNAAGVIDPLKYYDLERYLFETVRPRFHHDHSLGAFDFFSIVIWKANRAKSKVAGNLLKRDTQGRKDLEAIIHDLTSSLWHQPNDELRMRTLLESWRMRLPMASAVLSVLWPEQFTVYDVRACDELLGNRCGDFRKLSELKPFEKLWKEYGCYINAVHTAVKREIPLRDKDRFLWGQSAMRQLAADIRNRFDRAQERPEHVAQKARG